MPAVLKTKTYLWTNEYLLRISPILKLVNFLPGLSLDFSLFPLLLPSLPPQVLIQENTLLTYFLHIPRVCSAGLQLSVPEISESRC